MYAMYTTGPGSRRRSSSVSVGWKTQIEWKPSGDAKPNVTAVAAGALLTRVPVPATRVQPFAIRGHRWNSRTLCIGYMYGRPWDWKFDNKVALFRGEEKEAGQN
jgi:hypothetical protein